MPNNDSRDGSEEDPAFSSAMNPLAAAEVRPTASPRSSVMSLQMESTTPLAPSQRRCTPKLAVGVTLLVIMALAASVATILYLSPTSGPKFRIPEKFSAEVIAHGRVFNVSDPAKQVVTGSVHKVPGADGEWKLSAQMTLVTHGKQSTTLTLLDNTVYQVVSVDGTVVSQRCLTSFDSPYVDGLREAVDSATPIPDADIKPTGGSLGVCEDTSKWLATLQGQAYVMCGYQNRALHVAGSGFVADIQNVDLTPTPEPAFGIPTNVTSGQPMNCAPLGPGFMIERRGRRLQTLTINGFAASYDESQMAFPPAGNQEDPVADSWFTILQPITIGGGGRRLGEEQPETQQRVMADHREAVASPAAAVASAKRASEVVKSTTEPRDEAHRRLQASVNLGYYSRGTPRRLNPNNENLMWFYMEDQDADLTCVFVHGAGTKDGYSFFGGTPHQLKGCRRVKYVNYDAVNFDWQYYGSQVEFCRTATDGKGRTIKDTIIFAHGMGNLVVASALKGGECGIDFKSSVWVEMQASYPQGRIAEFALFYFCGLTDPQSNPMVAALQEDMQLCDSNDHVSTPWVALRYDYPGIETVADIVLAGTSASLCGFSPKGLMGSPYADIVSQPWAPSSIVANSPVWSQCWDTDSMEHFYPFPSASRYMSEINYMDTTLRNGEAVFSETKLPVFWADAMVFLASDAQFDD